MPRAKKEPANENRRRRAVVACGRCVSMKVSCTAGAGGACVRCLKKRVECDRVKRLEEKGIVAGQLGSPVDAQPVAGPAIETGAVDPPAQHATAARVILRVPSRGTTAKAGSNSTGAPAPTMFPVPSPASAPAPPPARSLYQRGATTTLPTSYVRTPSFWAPTSSCAPLGTSFTAARFPWPDEDEITAGLLLRLAHHT